MDLSIFLAKTLGLYLVIMAIVLWVNMQKISTILKSSENSPFLLISGLLALIFGILLVVSHNVWVADWRVIITIIGWLALIKGLLRLLFPDYAYKIIRGFADNIQVYYITDIIILIVGIYLCYVGY